MPEQNEPKATARTDAAAASVSAQVGAPPPGAVPTTAHLFVEIEATKVLLAQGFCSEGEARVRLQAIRLAMDLLKHCGNGAALTSAVGGDITALAKECEGRPELLRAMQPVLTPAVRTELLNRMDEQKRK